VRVIHDDIWLCSDCTQVACNGEHGIELSDSEATIRGLSLLGPHLVPDCDSETGEGLDEFSRTVCDACKTPLAGYRARFAILGD
jgi:hypothetical protein